MSSINKRAIVFGSIVSISLLALLSIRYIPKPTSQKVKISTPNSYIDQIQNTPKGEYTKREIFKLYQYSTLTELERIAKQKEFAQKLGVTDIEPTEYQALNVSICKGFEAEGVDQHLAKIQNQLGNNTKEIEKYAFFSLTAPYFQCPKYLPDVLNISSKSNDKSNLKLPLTSS
jgi:hypothetical protein